MLDVRLNQCSRRYLSGPLDIVLDTDDDVLLGIANEYFSLHGRSWGNRTREVRVSLRRGTSALQSRGGFLRCARMNVDLIESVYLVRGISAICATGNIGERSDSWEITVPPDLPFTELQAVELQDVLGLTCAVAWRAEGWIGIHAAAVANDRYCALLCASSGGGKSTLTTALINNGWKTLGDDKVLLRRNAPVPHVASLLLTFNLDPRTSQWFSKMPELAALPRYSEWTDKRRVSVEDVLPGCTLDEAAPTHVVSVVRNRTRSGTRTTAMQSRDILPTLLKQIVLPSDRCAAAEIVGAIATVARNVRGFVFEVGDDAYRDPSWLNSFDGALARSART